MSDPIVTLDEYNFKAAERLARRRHRLSWKTWLQLLARIRVYAYAHYDEPLKRLPFWRAGACNIGFNRPYLANSTAEKAWGARRHFQPEFHFEWAILTNGLRSNAGISLQVASYRDHDVTFHIGALGLNWFASLNRWRNAPPVSWLVRLAERPVRGDKSRSGEREIGLSWHDGTLWWCLWWTNDSWSKGDPKWRSGHWNAADAILGRTKYASEQLHRSQAFVSLREYDYPVRVTLTRDTWTRPRLPWLPRAIKRARIAFTEYAPPFNGKGENSWDCGLDTAYSMTCPASTVAEAVEHLRASILESRQRHGDREQWDHTTFKVGALSDDD